MIRVGLVTNVGERCGIAEYGRNLLDHVPDVAFTVLSRPHTVDSICQRAQDVDIVHFNYSPLVSSGMMEKEFREVKTRLVGKKLVITLHDSYDERVRGLVALDVVHAIVVHEQAGSGQPPFPDCVHTIPMGIRFVDVDGIVPERKIGTAGFPFSWKRFEDIAKVARETELKGLFMISQPEGFNSDPPQRDIVTPVAYAVRRACPGAEVTTGWLEYEDMVRKLAGCCVTAFPYDYHAQGVRMCGISGAVRFGLAARRPVIVSLCRQFRDLFVYDDEVYFADKGLEQTVNQVLYDIEHDKVRMPKRILEDMSWTRCGQMYADVYKGLLNKEA